MWLPGRIWATLYLAPEPLSQNEICDLLGLSTGLVSSSLKELERLQFVKLLYVPIGDGSIPHLARCKRVMSIHIFGSKMTAANPAPQNVVPVDG